MPWHGRIYKPGGWRVQGESNVKLPGKNNDKSLCGQGWRVARPGERTRARHAMPQQLEERQNLFCLGAGLFFTSSVLHSSHKKGPKMQALGLGRGCIPLRLHASPCRRTASPSPPAPPRPRSVTGLKTCIAAVRASAAQPAQMERKGEVKVVKLRAVEATPESFAPFGQVITASPDGDEFGPHDAQLDLSSGIPRYVIHDILPAREESNSDCVVQTRPEIRGFSSPFSPPQVLHHAVAGPAAGVLDHHPPRQRDPVPGRHRRPGLVPRGGQAVDRGWSVRAEWPGGEEALTVCRGALLPASWSSRGLRVPGFRLQVSQAEQGDLACRAFVQGGCCWFL